MDRKPEHPPRQCSPERRWIDEVYRPWYEANSALTDSGGNSPPPPPPGDGG